SELQNLIGYKSNGVDDSLLRKYILNPYIYETSIKLFPKWIAPNMITLTGFSFICISLIFSYIYAWGDTFLMGYLPRWVFFINALCIFLYQTFDNLDGKQARNMKQSSPLGEMFDHGVDALTCTLGGMAFLATAAAGNYGVWQLSVSGDLPFITATWEEFHIGYLYLGFVNGPIEGVLSIVFSQLI
ncbi:predicted protein, partial [Naegleria gruberi]